MNDTETTFEPKEAKSVMDPPLTIATLTIDKGEYDILRAKAEIYDLLRGVNQANARIAEIERAIFQNGRYERKHLSRHTDQ